MERGKFKSGLSWSAYSTTSSESNIPSIVIEDLNSGEDECAENDNYLITFPDDDSDVDSAYDTRERTAEEVDSENDLPKKLVNRFYDNPLFIPASEVSKREISGDGNDTQCLMKTTNFMDYKFCDRMKAVNDFDIELESEEAVPIVYLSTSRAACLQRSLRLAGYKKVGFFVLYSLSCIIAHLNVKVYQHNSQEIQ